ncbi:MAG: (4Fe-4S)-binding protein [Cyclobacteriaceae bacterium]|jgi:uncharacterized Fe-S cluster protein YjdI|nr:(4Fe-4S)-binding protein [Flammeovirgaceae bacterium]
MKDITKKYTNGEVTVVWKPNECIHSTICFKGLGEVFDPRKRPWITPEGASTDKIIEQVKKCPSGALSYYLNRDADNKVKIEAETIVETMPNGPLLVYGNVSIKDKDGNLTQKNNVTAFCRCGASSNKPFCDGSHKKIGFEG